MKKGKAGVCLLAVLGLAGGMLGGCGSGNRAGETRVAAETTYAAAEYAVTEAAGVEGDTLYQNSGMNDGDAPGGMEGAPAAFHTEEYSYNPENAFMAVADAPLSTFGADVDTASYANIRRMALDGERIPEDAVRIEEMLNYFYYDYPEPKSGEPFSVTTRLSQCPWNKKHDLLQLGMQAEKLDGGGLSRSNLVFLLDVSGSMDAPDKLDLVKRAFLMLAENLRPEDTISIVTYASDDRVVLDGVSGDNKTRIMSAIENLWAGGSTAGSKGIETAYELAGKHFIKGGNNRVILATDGDLNVGVTSEGDLTRLIQEKKKSGVYLSVLGFGTGNLKDNKMEALADHGNGQYAYVDSLTEAKKVLVEEMGGTLFTVAKDVKLQVEFNPSRVKGYRLIGYENRLMEARDFDDDTKDGGEIGAGHRVTALYELIPADSGEEMQGVELKYQQAQDGGRSDKTGLDSEWLTVKIRYKEPDADVSKLLEYPVKDDSFFVDMPEDMIFASCVAETGMLLKQSEYAGDSSYEDVINRLNGLDRVREDDYSQEFLYLVKRIANMGK